jgi:hypothetical protein
MALVVWPRVQADHQREVTMSERDAASETTEPEIYITVQRLIKGQRVHTIRRFDLLTYKQARWPGMFLEVEINGMLSEVGYE